jgi:hypothetical protein
MIALHLFSIPIRSSHRQDDSERHAVFHVSFPLDHTRFVSRSLFPFPFNPRKEIAQVLNRKK